MSVDLATTRVGAADATRSIVMLHGIYGRGRNWQAIAKALVAVRPDYACWLVDLPHHGDSGPTDDGADSVEGLAAAVTGTFDGRGITADALLGHSFGGKVALAMADIWRDRRLQIWVIDSTPETRKPSGSAWDLLDDVRRLPSRFPSRDALTAALTSEGWSSGIAQWMATNLRREGEELVWRLDFDAMERLLHSFFTTDLWFVVERRAETHTMHFVRASESSAMSDEAVDRTQSLQDEGVVVHHAQGGHWIHAESPETIVELLAAHLP